MDGIDWKTTRFFTRNFPTDGFMDIIIFVLPFAKRFVSTDEQQIWELTLFGVRLRYVGICS